MQLISYNPWWDQKKKISLNPVWKRKIFDKAAKELATPKIIVLSGLRRTGKSTIMHQLINELLAKGQPEKQIFYFTFREEAHSLKKVLDNYLENILKKESNLAKKTYIFLDEIQYASHWQKNLAEYLARHKNLKFIISGSTNLHLNEHTPANIKNKFSEIKIMPLSFAEYLEFKNIKILPSKETLFAKDLKKHLANYLLSGGFIETISLSDQMQAQYIQENILERVIYKDIPLHYKISKPAVLNRLARILAFSPGLLGNYKKISAKLNCDQRTIAKYIHYLAQAHLVQILYNFSSAQQKKEKTLKRLYLANPAFSLAINPEITQEELIKQFYLNIFQTNYFNLNNQKQNIDGILKNKQGPLTPLLVILTPITKTEIRKIWLFMQKHKCPKGYVITLDKKNILTKNQQQIEFIPYWRYFSLSALKERT
jgi:uncharacterized protein